MKHPIPSITKALLLVPLFTTFSIAHDQRDPKVFFTRSRYQDNYIYPCHTANPPSGAPCSNPFSRTENVAMADYLSMILTNTTNTTNISTTPPPPFCGMSWSTLDLHRIAAIKELQKNDCGTCLRVCEVKDVARDLRTWGAYRTPKPRCAYVLVVDRGMFPLDVSTGTARKVFNDHNLGYALGRWEPVAVGYCHGIWDGTMGPMGVVGAEPGPVAVDAIPSKAVVVITGSSLVEKRNEAAVGGGAWEQQVATKMPVIELTTIFESKVRLLDDVDPYSIKPEANHHRHESRYNEFSAQIPLLGPTTVTLEDDDLEPTFGPIDRNLNEVIDRRPFNKPPITALSPTPSPFPPSSPTSTPSAEFPADQSPPSTTTLATITPAPSTRPLILSGLAKRWHWAWYPEANIGAALPANTKDIQYTRANTRKNRLSCLAYGREYHCGMFDDWMGTDALSLKWKSKEQATRKHFMYTDPVVASTTVAPVNTTSTWTMVGQVLETIAPQEEPGHLAQVLAYGIAFGKPVDVVIVQTITEAVKARPKVVAEEKREPWYIASGHTPGTLDIAAPPRTSQSTTLQTVTVAQRSADAKPEVLYHDTSDSVAYLATEPNAHLPPKPNYPTENPDVIAQAFADGLIHNSPAAEAARAAYLAAGIQGRALGSVVGTREAE
ncbi:MAG: hypothetical protein M1827_000348 [Pycnora praestabilis]|nr:MAG: hypothetical protein M1827_000348 [Pycnora praestabilis]